MTQERKRVSAEIVRDVKERFTEDLSKTPNFTGIGIGLKEIDGDEDLVIVVNLTKELTDDQIQVAPKEIEGVSIQYRIASDIHKTS